MLQRKIERKQKKDANINSKMKSRQFKQKEEIKTNSREKFRIMRKSRSNRELTGLNIKVYN